MNTITLPSASSSALIRIMCAEYALGGLNNSIFASTCTLNLPGKEQLEEQVRRMIEANERKLLGEPSENDGLMK